jgi:CDP-glucose 4,6-dehydratase
MGTVHVLESARDLGSIKATVIVTTDKCYENKERPWGYRENEAMGGHDPYSSSKGCAELVVAAYRRSFFSGPGSQNSIATARAGNVIGGGDRSENRLIPDLVKSINRNEPIKVRNPNSIRPWQHVLDCLNGYLSAVEYLNSFDVENHIWNFGPDENHQLSVQEVCELALTKWPGGSDISIDYANSEPNTHKESEILTLNSNKAKTELGWINKLNYEQAIELTMQWEFRISKGEDPLKVTQDQISNFLKL